MDNKDFLHLTHLCRIACSEDEKKKLMSGLERILAYIEELKELPTEEVPPTHHILEMSNVMRPDLVGETLPRDLFLSNAKEHTGGMLRVPPVMK